MVLIGSMALWGNNFSITPHDIDIVCTFSEWNKLYQELETHIVSAIPKKGKVNVKFTNGKRLEVSINGFNESDQWLLDHEDEFTLCYIPGLNAYAQVPPVDLLYTIKKSHVHCDTVHFDKTMEHYHILKGFVDGVPERYMEFFKLRKQEAEERYRHRTPSLNMSNDEFFDRSKDIVGYVFVHDTIHEAVKHYDVPVYEMIKRDFSKAKCESDMFHELEHIKKIRCVQEEAYVIAIERYLLLDGSGDSTPYTAYKKALRRICTTLCSGFFREFAIDHYYEILKSFDPDYIRKFERGFNDRTIQKLDTVDHDRINDVMTTYIENTN